jgi:hypothetical protein
MATRTKNRRMTLEEARAFKERWRLVNEYDRIELQRMTPAEKFRQLEALMDSARAMGWIEKLESEPNRASQNWLRLRDLYRV